MITSNLKDAFLKSFIEAGHMSGQFYLEEEAKGYDVTDDALEAMCDEFEGRGFFTTTRCIGGLIMYNLTSAAFDFYNSGGFTNLEMTNALRQKKLELDVAALELQLEVLANEASKIRSRDPKLAERLIGVASNIASITGTTISLLG